MVEMKCGRWFGELGGLDRSARWNGCQHPDWLSFAVKGVRMDMETENCPFVS